MFHVFLNGRPPVLVDADRVFDDSRTQSMTFVRGNDEIAKFASSVVEGWVKSDRDFLNGHTPSPPATRILNIEYTPDVRTADGIAGSTNIVGTAVPGN